MPSRAVLVNCLLLAHGRVSSSAVSLFSEMAKSTPWLKYFQWKELILRVRE